MSNPTPPASAAGGSWQLVPNGNGGFTWALVPENYFPQTGLSSDIPDPNSGPGGGWSSSSGWGYGGGSDSTSNSGGGSRPADPNVGFSEYTAPSTDMAAPSAAAESAAPTLPSAPIPGVSPIGQIAPGLSPSISGPSILGKVGGFIKKVGGISDKLSPILGGAAKGRADNQFLNDESQRRNRQLLIDEKQFALDAPQKRLTTSARANLLSNYSPSQAEWGGPGSGLKGQTVKFTGGFNNPNLFGGDTKALADDVMHKQLTSQLQGDEFPAMPDPSRSTLTDKVLGGGATFAAILAALKNGYHLT